MAGNCSWEIHAQNRNKVCSGVSESPELYGRGFLTMDQIETLPPPAIMSYIFLLNCLCGLVGNGVVLWFFSFSIKRNPFSIYFLHMAVADVGYLFCKAVLSVLQAGAFPGSFPTYVHFVSRILSLAAFLTSVSLLPAVSIERCLSVLFPTWYCYRRPKHTSALVCALLWALAFLLTTVHTYFCVYITPKAGDCTRMDITLGILLFFILAPLMVLACLVLVVKAECRAPRRHQSSKLNNVILSIVAVFLVSSIYLSIDWFLFWVFQIPAPFPEYITDLFICVNCSAKPVVYFLAGRDEKQRFWEPLEWVFQRALRDGAELKEGGDTPNTVAMEMQPAGPTS
uniref:Mas-related G-protein coupled receptor member F n=1 Tax=Monodelphis domestica TaxID=13616 RepID=F7C3B1_MONDO